MHEMSLCEAMAGIIAEQARAQGFARVLTVRLEIGRFAGVEADALRFGFDVVTRGGPAEGARLEIVDLPGRAFCFDCAETVSLQDRLAPCPSCGGARLAPTGGDEMRIKDLEVV